MASPMGSRMGNRILTIKKAKYKNPPPGAEGLIFIRQIDHLS